MFIARQDELAKLNSFYESEGSGVAVVDGPIGMGKTTLVRHFCSDKNAIIYEAYETTSDHQIKMISDAFNVQLSSFEDFCDYVSKKASTDKVLLVIDQYSNIVRADTNWDATLFSYFKGPWATLNVKIILMGDACILMDKYVSGKKSIWRDDISLKLTVDAFGFYDTCEFINSIVGADKEISDCDRVLYYGITGGIPYNLRLVTGDIEADIKHPFLDVNAQGVQTPQRGLSLELRELSYYNHMLAALAIGHNRVNQISAEVGKPKDVVVPYLNTLMAMNVCTKDTAITEITNRKKTRYSIVNTSTLFWYKYIVPHMNMYCNGEVDKLYNLIMDNIDDYIQTVFIKVCGQCLEKLCKEGKYPFTIDVMGNWWVNDDEAGTTEGFDLVALGTTQGKQATVYCQCYYNENPIEIAQLKSLIDKTKQVHRQGDAFYMVFAKNGFHDNAITVSSAIKNIMLVKLDDMI